MIFQKRILDLNKQLISVYNDSYTLVDGKVSLFLYFYYLSRIEDNKLYKKTAEKHLDEVMNKIASVAEIDIKNGLAGIGLGIEYLIKNGFVSGNTNFILQDIDDYLFRFMNIPKYNESLSTFTMLQILFYFSIRLQDQKQNSENEYLFKEIVINSINSIYSKIDEMPFGGRLTYNIEYELPLFLYVLSKIYSLNFYNNRITNILKEISPLILSTIPLLHANKLYLLWGMTAINEQIKISDLDKYIELLKRELDLDEIINKELKNRNIFFNDGATSIFLFAENIKKHLNEAKVCIFQQKLLKKIEQSEVWHLLETNSQYFNIHTGLYDGFCGVALLLMNYAKDENKIT